MHHKKQNVDLTKCNTSDTGEPVEYDESNIHIDPETGYTTVTMPEDSRHEEE